MSNFYRPMDIICADQNRNDLIIMKIVNYYPLIDEWKYADIPVPISSRCFYKLFTIRVTFALAQTLQANHQFQEKDVQLQFQ